MIVSTGFVVHDSAVVDAVRRSYWYEGSDNSLCDNRSVDGQLLRWQSYATRHAPCAMRLSFLSMGLVRHASMGAVRHAACNGG